MKKMICLICIVSLSLSLAACGKDGEGSGSRPGNTQQEGADTGPEQTAEPEETASEPTENPTESIGEIAGWSEEMEKLRAAVVETLGENYWPNFQISPEMLENTYGVSPELYEDYMGEMPMISTNVDTLIIIKAKEENMDAIEDALEAYREALVNDTMQYPMNLSKIQASRVERLGDYVCFVQLGADTTEAMDSGEEAAITHCQEQNELALEVISQNTEP